MKEMESFYREAKKLMKQDYFYDMPNDEINKQHDKLLRTDGNDSNEDGLEEVAEDKNDWELPIPNCSLPERARIVGAFYGPEADTLAGDATL